MVDFTRETFFDDPKQAVIETITERMGHIKRRIGELKDQINQTQQMVDREQQRFEQTLEDLQIMDADLEHKPRVDIRDAYKDALDARFRLTSMIGQLEKMKSQYTQFEEEQRLLSGIITKMQGVASFSEGEGTEVEEQGKVNIVRIVHAQEEERQRLARQMHDGPAQSLTNFILQAEICQRLFDRNPERAGEELINLKNAASVTFQKVRDFIFDLRPMMLDDLGVIPTVRRWVDSVREKTDVNISLEIHGEEKRLPEQHKEVMIFRAIQDLVGYARDYANASQIRVKVEMGSNPIQILVHDNGRAVDVEDLMSRDDHQDTRMQGFLTLKEKFELVRGSFTISSNDTEGTLVRLDLPA